MPPTATATTTPPIPHLPGVEHRWLDAGGLLTHVAEAGAGEPLVMLHGWPQNWYAFRRVIPELSRHYRVVCPDLRGWGWTEAPASGYDKPQLVHDVLALLDALQLDRVRLLGHDWGSIIGFMLCLRAPERISRYLALGGAQLWPKVDLTAVLALRRFWYQAVVASPLLGQRLVASPRFVRLLYRVWSAREVWTDSELEALIGQFSDPARARATVLMYRTWLIRELPRIVAGAYRGQTLHTPTLFLHGEEDGCIDKAFTRRPARETPEMVVELLPGVGHFVAEEAPELVIARAIEFFAPADP